MDTRTNYGFFIFRVSKSNSHTLRSIIQESRSTFSFDRDAFSPREPRGEKGKYFLIGPMMNE